MKSYRLFLIDLDGTIYRGTEEIEEASIFIQQLQEAGQEYLFLTNNSSKRQSDVVQHLATFGIKAEENQVYSTSLATAHYIAKQKAGASVFMIGEEGLLVALEEAGCRLITEDEDLTSCDFVIIGIDRHITYEKLTKAALAIRSGAIFISTNADKALPTERGLLPGNGSLTACLTTTTGVDPLFIGKPESFMIDLILEQRGLNKEDLIMIGDNYETDILAGIKAGIDTAIVFTGYTSKKQLEGYETKPTYQWDHLLEWRS
jgi:4-nitrophenyl phosphatase